MKKGYTEHKMTNPLVSCVIPTHNRVDLLPRALESVLNQTYANIEVIVVSDGSTDNTNEIMNLYCESDKRIKFINYFPARGGNIARNTGIEKSNGEYIAFLDDDDEWMPDKIEKQIRMMKDKNVGLVYTGVRIIYVNEDVAYSFMGKEEGNLSEKIMLDNCIGTTSTVMIRKALLNSVGMFDVNLRALQDYDLWIRLCQVCNVAVVREQLINYYNYTGNLQVSSSTKKYLNSFNYINNKYEVLFNNLSAEKKCLKQKNEYILLANKSMRNGNKGMARKYLKKALRITVTVDALAYWILSFTSFKTILKLRCKK